MSEVMEAPAPKTYSTALGDDIDRVNKLWDVVKALEEKVKEAKAIADEHERLLFERMEQEKTTLARGSKARASIKESIVPKVENWDDFYRFIHRNNAYHLLERRAAAAPYRELLAQRKNGVPGVVPYTKRTITITAI